MTTHTTTITSAEFSLFEKHLSTQPSTTTVAEVFQKIIDPNSTLVVRTHSIHSIYNANGGGKKGKKAIAPLKAELPTVAFAATGDRKVVEKPSGLLCIDIDEIGDKKETLRSFLSSCPFVVTHFVSPSGDGIKAVFRIPVINGGDQKQMRESFNIAFKAVAKYILDQCGVVADPACSDMLRLCYLPHDPEAYLNEDATAFPVDFSAEASTALEAPRQVEIGSQNSKPSPIEIVRPLLFSIAPRPSYEVWLKVSAAARNALGNTASAVALLKEWSPEEEEGEYAHLLESGFDEIGIGTLRHYARQNDYFSVFECFAYDESTGHFLLRWGPSWVRLRGEGTTKDHLRQFLGKLPDDCPLCEIRTEHNVAYAGEIAGHRPGISKFNGKRILILEGPKIVTPSAGDWPTLQRFLQTLIQDEEQHVAFLAWLQHCRSTLLSGRRRQSPALALVGDRGNGKSLLISVINRCLGGRSASGYRYLSGSTPFNSDIVGAELLVIDDEAASTDFRTRLKLAQNIKSHFFTESVRLEAKGIDAITVAPIQALAIAVNSDPQHIRILPEIDDTMRDKIVLISTNRGEIPAHLRGSNGLEAILLDEIPGFLHFLESQDYSSHYDSGRLRCHWCPQVVDSLCVLAPEMQLHALIAATPSLAQTFRPGAVVPQFTAIEVQAALMENSGTKYSASTLLTYPNSCGIYLGKLANIPGTGISRGRIDSRTRIQLWGIDLQSEESE